MSFGRPQQSRPQAQPQQQNAPPQNANRLRVNPEAFEQDYEYQRALPYEVWVPGFILGANVHTKRGTTSQTLKLVIGARSTDTGEGGKLLGAKVDLYVPLAGPKYRDVVAIGDPDSPKRYTAALAQGRSKEEAQKAAETNLDKWAGIPVEVMFEEEVDNLKSASTGLQCFRPRVSDLRPFRPQAPAATPPAAAPQSGASLL